MRKISTLIVAIMTSIMMVGCGGNDPHEILTDGRWKTEIQKARPTKPESDKPSTFSETIVIEFRKKFGEKYPKDLYKLYDGKVFALVEHRSQPDGSLSRVDWEKGTIVSKNNIPEGLSDHRKQINKILNKENVEAIWRARDNVYVFDEINKESFIRRDITEVASEESSWKVDESTKFKKMKK